MVEWFSWVQIAVALVVGLIAIGMAVAKRGPNDVTVLGLALVELLLVVQLVLAIVAPLTGNPMLGNALEFWMYLVAALIIPPAAIVWGLIEKTRWSNLILATAALGIAVMVFRMHTIWFLHAPGYA
ncbi:MAG: hypothetical protein BGO95_02665 [Micrococcales bacterium 73-13]|nr:MAG: hypothetical protein BGO95_02665 [Micrococcales bacterium 73-13]